MRGNRRYLIPGNEFIISRWSLKRTSLRCNARWREIGNEDGSNTPASMLFFFNSLREPSSIEQPEALSSSLCCPVSLQYWTLVVRVLRSGSSTGTTALAAASAFLHLHFHLRLPFLCFVEVAHTRSFHTKNITNSPHINQKKKIKNPPYPTLSKILLAPNPINLFASFSPTPSASSTVPTTSQILSSTISFSFSPSLLPSPSTTLKTCPLNSKTPVFSSQQLSTPTGALHPPFSAFKKLLSALHVKDEGMWFNGDNNLRIRASECRISRPRAPWPGAWRMLFLLFLLVVVVVVVLFCDKYSLIRPSKPIRLRPAAARIRQSYFCLLLLLLLSSGATSSSSFRSRV